MKYDYIIVGSGLYGSIFAREATNKGYKCLVIDKRDNVGGNIYTEKVEGINVHKYGAHIFHTNNQKVWDYITQFATFNRFTNSSVANYKGELYALPFNMCTFNKMWGVVTPEETAAKIEEQKKDVVGEPKNLEEQAISLVGRDIYEKLIKGYTGSTDAYFSYPLGTLEYRSVRFETELLDKPNFQGNAAVNYTDRETPWTRIIEHKWLEFGKDEEGNDLPKTVISREYSSEWKPEDEPYYSVNDEKNGALYKKYKELADKEKNIIFGGRLGEYKYYDMDQVIVAALEMANRKIKL